jgi:hypothetical protein
MDEYSDFDVFASVELTVDERRALQLAEDLAGAFGADRVLVGVPGQ